MRILVALLALLAASPARADVLFENVTLIDGTGRPPLANASVLVKGERIVAVSPSPIAHEAGVEVIDGRGKFLLPGLIDAHIHLQTSVSRGDSGKTDPKLAIEALHGYLYSGVTSVYDSGNEPEFIFGMREQERAGKIVSPRIFASGTAITVPGGYGAGPRSLMVDDWREAKPVLEAYWKKWKPDLQKILVDRHGIFTPLDKVPSQEVMNNIVQLANENGVRTTVHAATEEDFVLALNAGIDAFAHPVRYPATNALITRVATKKIPVASTLVVFNYIARIAQDASFLDEPLFKATVNSEILTRQKNEERQRYIASGMAAQYTAMAAHAPDNARKIFEAGGVLALGTDRTWGPTVHMELDLLRQAGIPLPALVQIATLNGAIYLGKEAELGSIERGKFADLLVLNADPTADVKNFQAIDSLYKAGKRIDRAKLSVPAN